MPISTSETYDSTAKHRITGIVRELHPKSSDNWSRGRVELDTGRNAWVVAKFLLEVGEIITADATFNAKFKSYDIVEIVTGEPGEVSNGVVVLKLAEYLDGVGRVKAAKLGEKFPDLWRALQECPNEVAAFSGASVRDVIDVTEQLKAEQSALGRMSELLRKHWPNHLAKTICRSERLYNVAIRSPYKAIPLIRGLGWLIADEIGRKQGVKQDDPARIEAAIDHYYTDKVANDGHTRAHVDDLLANENLPSLLGIHAAKIFPWLSQVLVPLENGWLTTSKQYADSHTIADFFTGGGPVGGLGITNADEDEEEWDLRPQELRDF